MNEFSTNNSCRAETTSMEMSMTMPGLPRGTSSGSFQLPTEKNVEEDNRHVASTASKHDQVRKVWSPVASRGNERAYE